MRTVPTVPTTYIDKCTLKRHLSNEDTWACPKLSLELYITSDYTKGSHYSYSSYVGMDLKISAAFTCSPLPNSTVLQ